MGQITSQTSSIIKISKADIVHKVAYHNLPLLAMFMNPNPGNTKKDPVVKDVTHKWNEIKLKSSRDTLQADIASGDTTIYTNNEFVNYIANKSAIKIDDEILTVSAASYSAPKWTLTVARGAYGSTAAAHGANAKISLMNINVEGADASDYENDAGSDQSNYCQIFRADVNLSGTAQAMDTYGNENDIDVQISYKLPNLLQQFEGALMNPVGYISGDKKTRLMGGLPAYIKSTMLFDSQGQAFNLSTLYDDVWALVEQGVDPNDIMLACGQGVRKKLNDCKAKIIAESMKIRELDYNIDTLTTSDNIKVSIAPSAPIFAPYEYYLFPQKSVNLKFLRALDKEKLAKTGDSDRLMAVMEATAEFWNWKQGGALRRINNG